MFQSIAPITRTLILINIAIYAIQTMATEWSFIYFALWPWQTSSLRGVPPFEVWQLVTYGFMHGGPTHLFFNMLALFMFGSDIERSMGTRKYIVYYFVCVIGAAIAQLVVSYITKGPPIPTVGASGAIFGILLAFGIAFPERRIMLMFPPIPMPARVFVIGYGMLELALGIYGSNQGVAHFAHLGGMAAGYLLILFWRHGRR